MTENVLRLSLEVEPGIEPIAGLAAAPSTAGAGVQRWMEFAARLQGADRSAGGHVP